MAFLPKAALIAAGLLFSIQAHAADGPLRIGVSAGPYGEILTHAAGIAAREGLQAEIIEFTDWAMINAALHSGDLDANNFQHQPYLDNQIRMRGYDIVPVAGSIVVPMGLYSSKVSAVGDLPAGATVAIPNDPTNGARALFLLQKAGVIQLRDGAGIDATLADITGNPKNLRFAELDAAQLPRSLDDVAAAVITLNYAVLAGLDPKRALVLEDEQSRWHLVWAVRRGREDDARIRRFIEIYRSPEVREFVLTRFNGTILPTW